MLPPLPPIINHDDPLRPYTPPKKPKPAQGSKIKRYLLVMVLIFALVMSLLVIAVGILEHKIGDIVVKEANKQLKTKLTVNDFSVSLISGFPRVSADLEGVFLNDIFGSPLLKARSVSLQFSLFNLFSDHITISSVVVQEGVLVVKTDASGRNNYDIVRSSDNQKSSNLDVSIDKATLQNVRFIYNSIPNKQKTDLTIKKAVVSGKFGSTRFTLKSNADMQVAYIDNQGERWLKDKTVNYNAQVAVDMSKNLYQLDDITLSVASVPLQIKGLVQLSPQKGTFLNLNIDNKETNISNVFRLLPPQYVARLKDFQSSGAFNLKTTVKGWSNKIQVPDIHAEVRFKNGKIVSPKLKQPFDNISFEAIYDNKKSYLDVPNCHATFAGNPLQIRLKLVNLDDPSVSFDMSGAIPFGLALGFIDNSKISDGTGVVKCNALTVTGRYADMTQTKLLHKIQASGDLTFDNTTFKISGEPIQAQGILQFNNNGINVRQFTVKGAGSSATFTGTFTNWLPVLLADSTQQSDLQFDARLDAEHLDISKLVALSQPPPQKVVPRAYYYAAKGLPVPQYRKQFPILNRMNGRFQSNIKSFIYDKISGRQFKGDLTFTGNNLILRGGAVAMGGNWDIDGKMELGYRPHLFSKLITKGVNVSEFLRQCNNFNQDVMTNNNISGTLNSHFAINAYWDEGLNFLKDRLYVVADVKVTDGELSGVKMLESFSTFIKMQDLKKIKFSNLRNQFEVYRQTLHIPTMFIQSNALNLQICGDHTSNQDINYNIIVNAGQVLMNRFRLFNSRLDPQPDQRNGFFNLYYNINGNIDNFQYSSDKTGVKAAFTESESRKRDIQTQLDKYFNFFNL